MRPLHLAGIVTLAAVWGSSYLLIKIGLRDFSPGALVFLRAIVAAAFLGAVVAVSGPAARAALRAVMSSRLPFFALGLTQVALPFLLISAGETEVDSGLTAVLGATVPLCIAAVAPFADQAERATRRRLTGMLIGLVGVAVVVGAESIGSLGEALGSLAILAASMSYAIGSFVATRLFAGVPPMVKSFCAVAAGSILIAPLALFTMPSQAPSAGPVLAVLGLAIGGTALAFILLYALMDRIGPGRVSLNTYLIPVFALVYGAVFLDERLGPLAFAGLVLVLIGVAIAGRDDRVAEAEVV